MTTELDVLRIVSERLDQCGLPFMLTGSFALAYYATPRMTRDIDLVVALEDRDVAQFVAAFAADFYVDEDAARMAVRTEQLFNLMHLESGVKVDLIVRKGADYRQGEFARRQSVRLAGVDTWIVSREDLVLSKFVWARDSASELQLRDVRQLLGDLVDTNYYSVLGTKPRRGRTAGSGYEMNDTSDTVATLVADHHRAMTPEQRWRVASALFDTARAIVESSLPGDLSGPQRRAALARRLYGTELPEAAIAAFASFKDAGQSG